MNIDKLDTARAVEIFGWHSIHGPKLATLKIPAGSEAGAKMTLEWGGMSKNPWPQYEPPDKGAGCAELAQRVRRRNGAACTLVMPSQNSEGCYVLSKRGDIVVKREDLDGLTLPFAWSLLPRVRVGYLVGYSDIEIVISSAPPAGATDSELFELLYMFTNTPSGEQLDYRASLRAMREPKEAVDPVRVIHSSRTPPPVRQNLAQIDETGERVMVWTERPDHLGRYNQVAARLRGLLASVRPLPDRYEAAVAELGKLEGEVRRHPRYREARILGAAVQAVTRKR